MISLDNVWQLVENSSTEDAFNYGEIEALYNLLVNEIPEKSVVVEIGVEYGRSTTCIGLIAKERHFDFTAIDAWVQDNSREAKAHVEDYLIAELGLHIKLRSMNSVEAAAKFPHKGINLIHIDGDHTYTAVRLDCHFWLPKVKLGGYACFDDFGADSLIGVYEAVSEYTEENMPKWQFVGRYGNKLGVFKRIK